MKKLFNYTLPVVALCVLASCSEDTTTGGTDATDTYNGKELIAFSGEGNAITRATLTRGGFDTDNPTELLVKMVATDARATPATSRNTVTWATATATVNNDSHNTADLLGTDFPHSDVSYKTPGAGDTKVYTRYWDDAFGRNTKLSVYAVAVPGKTGKIGSNTTNGALLSTDGSVVDGTTNPNWNNADAPTYNVEWTISKDQTAATMPDEDLTYSNNIQEGKNKGRYTWNYSGNKLIMDDGYLRWIKNPSDANETTGKFDQGHLVFKHALSWITINLTEGEGFDNTKSTDFIWTGGTDQNITLYGFTLHGTLNVKTGQWSSVAADVKDITKMNETTATPLANTTVRTVNAYCLPGRDLSQATGNVIKFQIDGNDYYVTGTQILNAIHTYYDTHTTATNAASYNTASGFNTMKEGENYIINLTVGKKKIDDITAEVLAWEQVNSDEITPNNIHTKFTFEDRGNKLDNDDALKFYIYRAKQTVSNIITEDVLTNSPNYTWETGYNAGDDRDGSNPIRAEKTYSTDHWTTTWYWPDNKTYYHFRAVGDFAGNALADNFVTTATADYFNISSGSAYKDYIWGAPFNELEPSSPTSNTNKLTYSTTTGFDNTNGTAHQISKGISATDSRIKMLMFHVTSQVFVKVQTLADNQADKVNLYTDDSHKTQVNLLRIKKDGTVLMGTGLVTPSATITPTDAMEYKSNENIGATGVDAVKYFYGIVPQDLSRGDAAADKVGLQIITPDGNEYFIQDLSTYAGTVTTTNLSNPYTPVDVNDDSKGYHITSWRPHYQYYYTITIKKTGIQNITAAVLPWETVTGDLGTIDLEN